MSALIPADLIPSMKKSNKKGVFFWGVCSLCMLFFIYGQSVLPSKESGELSGFFMVYLNPILNPFGWFDSDSVHFFIRKAAHFTEFTLFSLSFTRLCGKCRWKNPILPLFAGLLVAVSDEFLQSFTGRGSSVRDVIVDFSGVLFGFGLIWLSNRFFRKKEKSYEA